MVVNFHYVYSCHVKSGCKLSLRLQLSCKSGWNFHCVYSCHVKSGCKLSLRLQLLCKKVVLNFHCVYSCHVVGFHAAGPGAGIMEADDRQVTTVFTVQPSLALDKPSIMKCYHCQRMTR